MTAAFSNATPGPGNLDDDGVQAQVTRGGRPRRSNAGATASRRNWADGVHAIDNNCCETDAALAVFTAPE